MYVYIRSEPGLFTVGFFSPDGKWIPESDYNLREDAANRVAYLNGQNPGLSAALNEGDGAYRP